MDISILDPMVRIAWLVGAVAFVLGLIQMNSPATARGGNRLSAAGMFIAVVATALRSTTLSSWRIDAPGPA